MMTKYDSINAADYIKNFACVGSKCVDTCCEGWNILVNKKTYEKYENCEKGNLKEKLNKHIKKITQDSNEDRYGIIELNKEGMCPFLDTSGLCSIQKELGAEYLPAVCNMYPRILNLIDGKLELSAVTSCIEVAKLVILNKQGINFEQVPNYKVKANAIFPIKNLVLNNKSFQYYFYDLRKFSINLVKNREHRLWERLLILGMFFQKLQQLINKNELSSINTLINDYQTLINNGAFKNTFDSINSNTKLQFQFIKEIAEMRIYLEHFISTQYLNCYKEMLGGLDYINEESMQDIEKKYDENFKSYYEPYINEKEYVLENYIVNLMFKNVFPYTNDDIFKEYIKVIFSYSYIKTHLIGMSGYYKEEFGDNQVINLIYSFSRTIEHNEDFINKVCEIIEKRNLNNIAFMAILIKN